MINLFLAKAECVHTHIFVNPTPSHSFSSKSCRKFTQVTQVTYIAIGLAFNQQKIAIYYISDTRITVSVIRRCQRILSDGEQFFFQMSI